MTSLEEARQQVINAARNCEATWKNEYDKRGYKIPRTEAELAVAVRELDALEQPDPWELLRDIRATCLPAYELSPRIDAALAWREAHPDTPTPPHAKTP